jgi:FkbM family methyltransferase
MIKQSARLLGNVLSHLRSARSRRRAVATASKLTAYHIKPVIVDIGSNGGLAPLLAYLCDRDLIEVITVDAQADWVSDRNTQRHANLCHIEAALGESVEGRKLYITKHLGCSSCLMPNLDFLKQFRVADWFQVIKEESISVTSYKNIHEKYSLNKPAIVKVDVQGFDMAVINGFGDLIADVVCVETEVHLEQLYKGQPVFADVYRMMKEKGFILRDLKPQGPFEGQAIEFNAYWSRDLQLLSPSQKLIHELWQHINGVWPGDYFESQNHMALLNGSLIKE